MARNKCLRRARGPFQRWTSLGWQGWLSWRAPRRTVPGLVRREGGRAAQRRRWPGRGQGWRFRCRTYQLLRIGSDPAQVSTGISMLDSDIAVLGPPERLEPLPKRNNAGQRFRIVLDVRMEERDATHARRLLRVHSERPRRRATNERDELAPLHSITASASASSLSGTARPSVLAVLRLIASSNLVDCITGRSAGFSPLRIRPA